MIDTLFSFYYTLWVTISVAGCYLEAIGASNFLLPDDVYFVGAGKALSYIFPFGCMRSRCI